MSKLGQLIKTIARILTFRSSEEELVTLDQNKWFFVVGFIGTWLVGIGRYWDSPSAKPLQMLGLGSLIYVFLLSFLLYVSVIPLRPKNWSYLNVLTFVSLTSFPAALYALPVERWMSFEAAAQMNVIFLGVVATYRVALYLVYMHRYSGLSIVPALVAVFLPILLIINLVTYSGYGGRVFELMAGLRERTPDVNDQVNEIIRVITCTSCVTFPILLLLYFGLIAARNRQLG